MKEGWIFLVALVGLCLAFAFAGSWGWVSTIPSTWASDDDGGEGGSASADYLVVAYNDLGMPCMNQDHSVLSILPPCNTLVAQVFRRGHEPEKVTHGITVEYRLVDNTSCQGTNFWDYVGSLFGVDAPFCTGLTGNRLSGTMSLDRDRFVAEGLPVTPFDENGHVKTIPWSRW